MALGFSTTSSFGDLQILPDKGLGRTTTPRVLKVQFGDGYEQRVAEGLNSLDEQYTISYSNRPKTEVAQILAFMDSKKGVTKFPYRIPDPLQGSGEREIQVVCESYAATYVTDEFYSFTATFRRVYEA